MVRKLGRIAGVDPGISRYLEIIRENLEDLNGSGPSRALRVKDFAIDVFAINARGELIVNPERIPSVIPQIQRRIDAVQAAQTDLSTLAQELLEDARFGVILGDKVGQEITLKVNVNNHVAGLGVAVVAEESGPITSSFVIQADQFAVVFPSPEWTPSTAFSQGQYCSATPDAGAGNILLECTTAGTTDTTEPTWNTTPGQTTNDGTAVWTARTIDERVPFIVGNVGGGATVGIDGTLIVDGTIVADAIASPLILTHQIVIDPAGYIRSGQTAYDAGTGWFIGNDGGTPRLSIGNAAGNKVTWDGSTLTVIGNVSGALDAGSLVGDLPVGSTNIAATGWQFDGVFSSTDADTVAWGAGTFRSANGDTYSIGAGNTGNMVARTYIYLDTDVSTTAFQVSTNDSDTIGANRVLVAVAEDGSVAPFFQVFGGSGGINGIDFGDMEGSLDLAAQVSGLLAAGNAAAGLVNSNITVNADGSLSGAGAGAPTLASITGTLIAGQIGAGLIVGNMIAGNTILGSNIAGTTITGDKIAASTITAGNLNVTNIAAITANLGTVTAGSISFAVSNFAPSWGGFSSAPSGNISYIDFGSFVLMFVATGLTGTSNANSMTITNVPSAIRPASGVRSIPCLVGHANIFDSFITVPGRAVIDSSGGITFHVIKPQTSGGTRFYGGYVDSAGTAERVPSGWSATRTGVGLYTVTHNLGLSVPDDFHMVVTPHTSFVAASAHPAANSVSIILVGTIVDSPADSDFSFVVENSEEPWTDINALDSTPSGFHTSTTGKGLPAGWAILYPK